MLMLSQSLKQASNNITKLSGQNRILVTWENRPNGVCSVRITCPRPPHVEHILSLEPAFDPEPPHVSHVSKCDNIMSFSVPNIASVKPRITSYLIEQVCVSIENKLF